MIDPVDGMPPDDQMLFNTMEVIQRLWQVPIPGPSTRKIRIKAISNIALHCSDAKFNGITFLVLKLQNLPDPSIKGYEI